MAMPPEERLEHRLHDLEVLYESLRAITATLDLGELVRAVLDTIKRVTKPEGVSLLLHDPERAELVFAASETLCEETLAGGAPTHVRRAEEPQAHRLALALRRGEEQVGTLVLRDRHDGRAFDDEDRRRVEVVACELAETAEPATIGHDAAALEAAFARVTAAVRARTIVLVLYDRGRELVFTSSRVLRPGIVDGARLRLDQGIAGWVATHRQPLHLDDASTDPRHDATLAHRTGLVPHSMICVPLVHRDVLHGVIQVINKVDGSNFTADEVRLVEALAGQAAIAIAHAQLHRQVEIASLTDDLTGLGNTRRFNAVLPALLALGGPVSLIVLDLDGLKQIVDRYGHQVGSRAIATVGRLIGQHLRPGDMAARYGGDEFVLVLPQTTTVAARLMAESIRGAIAGCQTPDGLAVDIGDLTASVGVATHPTHAHDAESLFRAADQAMYRIKFGGKNGVGVAGD